VSLEVLQTVLVMIYHIAQKHKTPLRWGGGIQEPKHSVKAECCTVLQLCKQLCKSTEGLLVYLI